MPGHFGGEFGGLIGALRSLQRTLEAVSSAKQAAGEDAAVRGEVAGATGPQSQVSALRRFAGSRAVDPRAAGAVRSHLAAYASHRREQAAMARSRHQAQQQVISLRRRLAEQALAFRAWQQRLHASLRTRRRQLRGRAALLQTRLALLQNAPQTPQNWARLQNAMGAIADIARKDRGLARRMGRARLRAIGRLGAARGSAAWMANRKLREQAATAEHRERIFRRRMIEARRRSGEAIRVGTSAAGSSEGPGSAAVRAARLGVALGALGVAVKATTYAINKSYENLHFYGGYSAGGARAQMIEHVGDLMRAIRISRATSDSMIHFAEASQRLKNALEPAQTALANGFHEFSTVILGRLADAIEQFNKLRGWRQEEGPDVRVLIRDQLREMAGLRPPAARVAPNPANPPGAGAAAGAGAGAGAAGAVGAAGAGAAGAAGGAAGAARALEDALKAMLGAAGIKVGANGLGGDFQAGADAVQMAGLRVNVAGGLDWLDPPGPRGGGRAKQWFD